MKASMKWIRALLPGLQASPEEVQTRLTAAGLEVEGAERQAAKLAGVITAEVRACHQHPRADKLSVCTVFDGAAEHEVICGAPNARAGLKVAFAPVGTTLPGGLTLTKKKIRGVVSSGMLCSEAELELSEAHDGIIELDPATQVGLPLSEVLGRDDVIFELGVTPNRPDVLSHFGLARSWPPSSASPRPRSAPRPPPVAPRSRPPPRCASTRGTAARATSAGSSPG